jgi:hypothetical protein
MIEMELFLYFAEACRKAWANTREPISIAKIGNGHYLL